MVKKKSSKSSGANLGFEKELFKSADSLRKNMDASEYKHIVLGLIFLKYVYDAFEERRKILLSEVSEGADPEDKDEYIGQNIFWVPKDARWSEIQSYAKKPNIGQVIDNAMVLIEDENKSLQGALPKDYSRPSLDKTNLGKLIDIIGNIGLGEKENKSKDVLGRVYEYFLGQFASAEGKGAGQFYTPMSVVKLLVEMIEPFSGRVFDPCCGSGGMFVQSEKFIEKHGRKKEDISIYGQESNETTWRLARMNLAIRQIDANIKWNNEGSFLKDEHPKLQADYILANPPFNDSDWSGDKLQDDIRWNYGIPPEGNANYAWVQHFIYHLSPNGYAGFVLANGALSSNTSGEGNIRQAIIEDDLVDCVVRLPKQLFYSTQISASLWFLTKDKTKNHRIRTGETLFIDARNLGYLVDRKHRELSDEDVNHIANTYHAWRGNPKSGKYEDVPGFCFAAKLTDIKEHRYALVPGRYTGTEEIIEDSEPFEEKIKVLTTNLESLNKKSRTIDKKIESFLEKFVNDD